MDPSAPKYHHAGPRNRVIWCQMALWSGPTALPSPRCPGFALGAFSGPPWARPEMHHLACLNGSPGRVGRAEPGLDRGPGSHGPGRASDYAMQLPCTDCTYHAPNAATMYRMQLPCTECSYHVPNVATMYRMQLPCTECSYHVPNVSFIVLDVSCLSQACKVQ